MMLIVAVALVPIVPITWMFIYEEKRPGDSKSFKHYMCELWDVVQTRAVYQYIAYQFFSGIFSSFTYVSGYPIQTTWANVSPLEDKIAGFINTGVFAIAVWFAGNYGRDWDWRRTAVVTMICNVSLDAVGKLLTIWDVVRSPWIWMGIPILEQIPQGIIFIVGSFIIVELSTEGHEGAMYGLLTTVYNLSTPFATAITRNVNGQFDLTTERIQNDSQGVRHDVTITVLIIDRSPLLRYGSGRANNDRDELPVQSQQLTVADKRGALPRLPLRTVFYAVNGVALFVLLFLCISMNNTISRLETQAGSSVYRETASEARQDAPNAAHEDFDPVAMSFVSKNGLIPMALLPSKFAVDFVTPRQDQAYRGTCWDFATIGFLEQSYRAHGVRKGWLKPNEYVAFSEQAYGVEILQLCTGDADSQQQKDCRVAGDEMWMNSTEGGEVPELYYLQNGLKESVFPQSVCEYYAEDGNDMLCPGLQAAQTAGNPLKFELSSMTTKYEDMSVREHLVRKNQAMPLSTPIAMVTHYYPCIGAFSNDRHCQPETCTLCPGDMATTTCCIPLKGGRNRNMEGEFFSHRGMSIEGGHAMLLVGYNDAFLTRAGFTGGLIVKNSWADGPYQGSHSLAYWMQEVSDWEERSVCPNSYNPFNWYQCGNEGISFKQQANNTLEYNEDILLVAHAGRKLSGGRLEICCKSTPHACDGHRA
ncbi:hypothetical protein PRNP1_009009 [Phytophthora ramorum]